MHMLNAQNKERKKSGFGDICQNRPKHTDVMAYRAIFADAIVIDIDYGIAGGRCKKQDNKDRKKGCGGAGFPITNCILDAATFLLRIIRTYG